MTGNSWGYLFTLLLIVISHFSFAQSKLSVGKHTINHRVFQVTKDDNKIINVLEENSSVNEGKENNPKLWYGLSPVYSSNEDINRSIVSVLGIKRINQLRSHERLTLLLSTDHRGKIIEIAYITDDECEITLEELDRLSTYIKNNVRLEIPDDMPANKMGSAMEVILFDQFKK
ncbi:MAG: hypothetical protein ACOH2A_01075 [Sphingobacteriaceae bacterium]